LKAAEFIKRAKALKAYFHKRKLPTKPARFKKGETIVDHKLFVKSHLATIATDEPKRIHLLAMRRLYIYKKYLKSLEEKAV